jgi:exosortase family protein XrtF
LHKFVKKYILKKYFIQYKPFLKFLGTFFLAYFILALVYQLYLLKSETYKVDCITTIVAKNTESILKIFDTESYITENKIERDFQIFYNQKNIARITEGCNAVSVIILFIAFVIAFSGKWKPTLLFIIGGSVLIYVLNVFRIAILCVLLDRFSAQEHLLHGVVFPLFIYGVVLGLWIFWVTKFSKYAK